MGSGELRVILKKRREAKGLTLSHLSRMTGIGVSHLARIERGERFPSGNILYKLAKPLGVTEVSLLKLAGFLSYDDTDEQIERLREETREEIINALQNVATILVTLSKKINNL